MLRRHQIAALAIACAGFAGCSAMSYSSGSSGDPTTCTIVAGVNPPAATADHALAAPANQVQFTASSTVTGNCPLTPDTLGTWATSDTNDITLSPNPQSPLQVTATCRAATATPATISYSGTVRGRAYTSATLSCK